MGCSAGVYNYTRQRYQHLSWEHTAGSEEGFSAVLSIADFKAWVLDACRILHASAAPKDAILHLLLQLQLSSNNADTAFWHSKTEEDFCCTGDIPLEIFNCLVLQWCMRTDYNPSDFLPCLVTTLTQYCEPTLQAEGAELERMWSKEVQAFDMGATAARYLDSW